MQKRILQIEVTLAEATAAGLWQLPARNPHLRSLGKKVVDAYTASTPAKSPRPKRA